MFDELTLEFLKVIWRRLSRALGSRTSVVVIVILALVWPWEGRHFVTTKITELGLWPMVESVVPLPKAKPDHFTVIVARFLHDSEDSFQESFVRELETIHGLEVLPIMRLVSGEADVRSDTCHPKGKALLDETGADVVLWGVVLRQGRREVPQVFWTSRTRCGFSQRTTRYAFTETLTLPQAAIADLVQIISALIESESNSILHKRQASVSSDNTIAKLRVLLVQGIPNQLSAESRRAFWLVLADLEALSVFYRSGETSSSKIDQAEATQRHVLKEYSGQLPPRTVAIVMLHLGQVLRVKAFKSLDPGILADSRLALDESVRLAKLASDAPLLLMAHAELANSFFRFPLDWKYDGTRVAAAVAAKNRLDLSERSAEQEQLRWAQVGYCNTHIELHLSRKDVARLARALDKCKQWAKESSLAVTKQLMMVPMIVDGMIYLRAWSGKASLASLSNEVSTWRQLATAVGDRFVVRHLDDVAVYFSIEYFANFASPQLVLANSQRVASLSQQGRDTTLPWDTIRRARLMADAWSIEVIAMNYSSDHELCRNARDLYFQISRSEWKRSMYPSTFVQPAVVGRCGGVV